jgi:hypothetical protein
MFCESTTMAKVVLPRLEIMLKCIPFLDAGDGTAAFAD